jgi:hypothetical protein
MALAERFEFSGGQIDNVIRKSEIHEVIRGVKVKPSDLIMFCNEELLAVKRSKMGFVRR